MAHFFMFLALIACKPKTTDTSEMHDVNPCLEGEILQADGSCIPAGDPIEPPPSEGEDSGRDTGDSGSDTASN